MNLVIKIDIGDFTDEIENKLLPNLDVVADGIMRALNVVRDTWALAVQGSMLPGMTRPVHDDAYFDSLTASDAIVMDSSLEGRVQSHYTLPNGKDGVEMHEHGYPAFDMKPGLLNGPRSRASKGGGRYNIVPFRHQTPGTVGALSASILPSDIYAYLRGRGPKPADMETRERLTKTPDNAQQLIDAYFQGAKNPMTGPYTWKVGKYAGVKNAGAERHSQYMTFRTVSTRSDPNSWIHPGMAPNPIMEAVEMACRPMVEEIIKDAWNKAIGG